MHISLSELQEGRTVYVDHVYEEQQAVAAVGATLTQPLVAKVQYTTVEGVTYLRIEVQGRVYARCDLCGTPCEASCQCTLDEELTPQCEWYDADTDSYLLDALLHEAAVMSAPRTVLCRPDCKGLCPICGANLNEQQCSCQQQVPTGSNNPFGILQDIFPNGRCE